MNAWETVGSAATPALVEARLQVHAASQVLAAVANAHGEKQADDSHTNLGWDDELGALLGHPVGSFQAGIRPRDLEIVLVSDGTVRRSIPADGKTLDGLRVATQTAIAEEFGRDAELELPGYDLPAHAVYEGATFGGAEPGALAELAAWYSIAADALGRIQQAHDGSPVRCWPHHFDIATLITVTAHPDPEKAQTVGAGMTPGDGSYAEPYWYVTPWPAPAYPAQEELAGGHWRKEGWFGAVQERTTTTAGSPGHRPTHVGEFLETAIAQGRRMLADAKEKS